MMLHEAVMLEIYRQALNASELVSPRCQSRESSTSGAAVPDGRCPSNDSAYSTHENLAATVGGCTPNKATTPVATTAASPTPHVDLAPAALLPQQSAAMAAYLNAANQLFLTNPLAASLVHAAPNAASRRLLTSNEDAALDFSVKSEAAKASDDDDDEEEEDEEDEEAAANAEQNNAALGTDLCAPLDLSCSNRKRQSTEKDATPSSPNKKIARINDFKAWATPTINPYLAAVAAASLSPKINSDWKKSSSSEACKALERMTEMTRLGVEKSDVNYAQCNNSPPPAVAVQTNGSAGTGGRHSAWQSHWLNKGAHSVKDVFKCVWCKQSFPTLATLTTHMKETKHCGVNIPTANSQATHSNTLTMNNSSVSHNNNNNNGKKSDLNLLIKETMPLPRKLVRGQDVWLGKGAEQTRQILKCMWCGQSFRSLAEMTAHMQETQHYTNIISQEQIISWKSSDDKTSNGATSPNSNTSNASNNLNTNVPVSSSAASSTVSAVLTCKVCDQAFATLKELSNHMVKNSHYKEPVLRQTSESPSLSLQRRGRQLREKRKKSLPVRKLLELERAGTDYNKSTNNALDPALKPLRDFAASTKISCEKCGDKIETALFVEHIRQCLGGVLLTTTRTNNSKSSTYSPIISDGRKHIDDNTQISPISSSQSSDILTHSKDTEKTGNLPSVLNALEQLIEKSFDTRPSRVYGGGSTNSTPLGASILKRLGIDDTVDYTKPLMDAHNMRFRSSSSYNSARDRSASESSSVSERCSSSLLEAATPERQLDISRQTTPRLQTPEKQDIKAQIDNEIKIKTEPNQEFARESTPNKSQVVPSRTQKITVKKEFNEGQYTDGDGNKAEDCVEEYANKHGTPINSPNDSERTATPTVNVNEKKLSGSSLNALNSMFNSLNNSLTFAMENNNNNNNTTNNNNNNNNNSNNINNNKAKKTNANPLAALQKLCETTTDPPTINTRSNNTNAAVSSAGGVSANMLSYGWDLDTMAKCAYCDTTFYTKGAYKQHLQKVHFIKDELSGEAAQQSPKSCLTSPRSASKSPAGTRQELSPSINVPTINPYEESPQSKFRKYTELAKQLSSKNN